MRQWLGVCLLSVVFGSVLAQSHPHDHKKEEACCHVSDSARDKIRAHVEALFPNQPIDQLSASPVSGLCEVRVAHTVFYASQDGRYLVMGDILDVSRGPEDRSLTEVSRRASRAVLFQSLKGHALARYIPKQVKGVLNVYTDPDCGYCRKLHEEIPALMDLGIQVNYLAFPRQGVGSPTYEKLVGVECAKDQKGAMDKVMKDESVPLGTCKNKVEAAYKMGQRLGINATPSMVFSDGTLAVGYRPAQELADLAIKHYQPPKN
jgi:thiol:disulfide interchange protein DsbC